ncbi:PD-(D/E)XK motif protein [Kribbella sp. NPDC050281]|uniref:PD-(D/E)XK motif protein n=1 Tax=Kribbella sp. NPDC050281 TaxID=3155515 RepID=UPI0034083F8B
MIDDIRLTYLALSEAPSPGGDSLVIRELGDSGGLFLGLDADRHQHLLLVHDGDLPELGLMTLTATLRILDVAGRPVRFIDIESRLEALAEVFEHFILAVSRQLEAERSSPAQVVESVLERWHLFLSSDGPPPSRDKLAALFGELLVLLDVVRADPHRRVDVWGGPSGSRHDFRRGSIAVEVKATRSHTSRIVTIHGDDQLEEPTGGTLFLHFIRLEEAAGSGRSVPSIVDELLALGASAEDLFTALARVGVPVAQLAQVSDVMFEVRERLTFPVDERAPRIVPSSFKRDERPLGVVDVRYQIDLDHVLENALDLREYVDVVNSLAAGGSHD